MQGTHCHISVLHTAAEPCQVRGLLPLCHHGNHIPHVCPAEVHQCVDNAEEGCEGRAGDPLSHEGGGPLSITGCEGLENLQTAQPPLMAHNIHTR